MTSMEADWEGRGGRREERRGARLVVCSHPHPIHL